MLYKNIFYCVILSLHFILSGCTSGDDSISGIGSISTNFPYLIAPPQVTFVQNVNDTTKYDVTVTLDADGPNSILAASLWIQPKDNSFNFVHMDLQYNGGTSWSYSTNPLLPMPAGDYYLDSIMLEDGDSFSGGVVKSGWYIVGLLSTSKYGIDQRETNWTTLDILNSNFGVSNIPVVDFTIP